MRTATRRATVYGGRRADWWAVAGQTCVAAYKAIGAADLATSYVNLANPGTYNAAPGTAPGLAAGGWTFNGTQSLEIILQPANDQSWSAIMRFADASGANATGFGSTAGDNRAFAIQQRAGSVGHNTFNGGLISVAPALTSGVQAVAGNKGYLNGVAEAGVIGAWGGTAALRLTIGGYYDGSNSIPDFIGTIAAIAIYSTTLSAPDVAALTTRMAALT